MLGAAWGIFWKLPEEVEGFLIALAGGALIVSALSELIEPALAKSSLTLVVSSVAAGAVVFTLADYLVERKLGEDNGGGLLASITLDGIPEKNLALGVALIGAGPMQVAALAGSIFLSNLPEAAGGAKEMAQNRSMGQVFALWTARRYCCQRRRSSAICCWRGWPRNIWQLFVVSRQVRLSRPWQPRYFPKHIVRTATSPAWQPPWGELA